MTTRPNPYVGPRAFQPGEKLYGRDRELFELLNLLIAERIVLFYSPSGAGKTSLIQAALLPELKKEKFQLLPVMRVSLEPPSNLERPPSANRYILSLLLSLEEELPRERQKPLAELASMDLAAYLEQRQAQIGESNRLILIFDQFEEILITDPTDQVAKIECIDQIGKAVEDRRRYALFALREDYVAALDPFKGLLPTRLRTTYRLDLLGEEAARLAVREPARQASVDFLDPAAQKLVNDLRQVRVQRPNGAMEVQPGPYVEPVQLQVVCRRLWDKLPISATQIVEADIEALGDVDKALADYYAERVAFIAGETGVSERIIREWCDRQLITEQGIRGQVLQEPEESQGLDNRAIWPLIDTHLVRAEKRRGATWFELAHDRLIEPIRKNNAAWREANMSLLQRQAAPWGSQSQPDSLLLRDQALAEAEQWVATHLAELTPIENSFLEACREAQRQRELEAAQRQRELEAAQRLAAEQAQRAEEQAGFAKRLRQRALYLSLALIAAVVMTGTAIYLGGQARMVADRNAGLAQQNAEIAHFAQTKEAEAQLASTQAIAQKTTAEAEADIRATAQAIALEQARLAASREWAAAAIKYLDTDPELSILLALQAVSVTYSVGEPVTPDAEEALHGAVQAWRLRLTLSGHTADVLDVAFSPDGTRLATASADKTVKVWDAASGQELLTLPSHADQVFGVAFNPDGTRLATASADGTAKVWDAISGQELLTLSGHADWVNGVAFSPDGTRLATASADGTAKVWDAISGQELLTLSGHADQVFGVTFSPDGTRLATASADGTAKVWDAISGQELLTLSGHADWVNGVAFSPDGTRLATASSDTTAKLWDAATGKELLTLSAHASLVSGVTFSPDGARLATASADGTAKIWDVASGQQVISFNNVAGVNGIAFSPGGTRLATASADGTVKVWDTTFGQELTGHADQVFGVAFSPDGARVATASLDTTAKAWDITSGQELFTLPGHTNWVNAVAFSPDGTRLATASADGTAKVWDAASGQELLTLSGHADQVFDVTFSPDGTRLATASADRTAKVWDATSGQPLLTLPDHTDAVYGIAFSPEGTRLATASADGTAKVWDAASGQELLTLSGHLDQVWGVTFSRPDGALIATASADGTAKVWDTASGQELLTLSGHTAPVYSVAFSPDNKRLATASGDGTVKVWDAESGSELFTLSHGTVVNDVAFSPDGKHLVTAGSDNRAHIFTLDIEELMALARMRVTRSLTSEECRKYLHMEQCPPTP